MEQRLECAGTVLLVEDNADWRESLEEILQGQRYAVVAVPSYGTALGELESRSFDLAVVDLRLSPSESENLDGMALLEDTYIHGVPTIVVSAYGTPKMAREAFRRYGVLGFIDKPTFDIATFQTIVSRAVDAGSESPPVERSLGDRKKLRELLRKLFSGEVIDFS